MKKWRRIFQWIFIRHVAAFEEELYPKVLHQPAADPEVVRCSIRRHFRHAQPDQPYLLVYDAGYEIIVTELHQEGWSVQLRVEVDGALAYCIAPRRAGISAHV